MNQSNAWVTDVAILANVLRKARHTTTMSQIGNSERLTPAPWPITQQHSVRLDDALENRVWPWLHLSIGEKGGAAGSYHAEYAQDEWYPLTASRSMGVGTRGPLSRLNTSQAPTHANVVATMMEVYFLFPRYLVEPPEIF